MTFFDGLAHGKSASREMFCQPAEIVLVSTSAHGAALPSALASANVGSPQLFLIPRSTQMTGSGQKPEAHYPTRGLPLSADNRPRNQPRRFRGSAPKLPFLIGWAPVVSSHVMLGPEGRIADPPGWVDDPPPLSTNRLVAELVRQSTDTAGICTAGICKHNHGESWENRGPHRGWGWHIDTASPFASSFRSSSLLHSRWQLKARRETARGASAGSIRT